MNKKWRQIDFCFWPEAESEPIWKAKWKWEKIVHLDNEKCEMT